jgi:hypothetical protein
MQYIEALYLEFNRKYFRNQLPKILVGYAYRHFDEWGYFAFEDGVARLTLSPALRNYHLALEGVLLHEMIHVALWNKYYNLGGYDEGMYHLWLSHTREFRGFERVCNQRHFGNPRGHVKFFDAMSRDLKRLENKNR